MEVRIHPGNNIRTFEGIKSVAGLLHALRLRAEEVLVIDLEKHTLLTVDEPLFPEQRLEIRRVISGG